MGMKLATRLVMAMILLALGVIPGACMTTMIWSWIPIPKKVFPSRLNMVSILSIPLSGVTLIGVPRLMTANVIFLATKLVVVVLVTYPMMIWRSGVILGVLIMPLNIWLVPKALKIAMSGMILRVTIQVSGANSMRTTSLTKLRTLLALPKTILKNLATTKFGQIRMIRMMTIR